VCLEAMMITGNFTFPSYVYFTIQTQLPSRVVVAFVFIRRRRRHRLSRCARQKASKISFKNFPAEMFSAFFTKIY